MTQCSARGLFLTGDAAIYRFLAFNTLQIIYYLTIAIYFSWFRFHSLRSVGQFYSSLFSAPSHAQFKMSQQTLHMQPACCCFVQRPPLFKKVIFSNRPENPSYYKKNPSLSKTSECRRTLQPVYLIAVSNVNMLIMQKVIAGDLSLCVCSEL